MAVGPGDRVVGVTVLVAVIGFPAVPMIVASKADVELAEVVGSIEVVENGDGIGGSLIPSSSGPVSGTGKSSAELRFMFC